MIEIVTGLAVISLIACTATIVHERVLRARVLKRRYHPEPGEIEMWTPFQSRKESPVDIFKKCLDGTTTPAELHDCIEAGELPLKTMTSGPADTPLCPPPLSLFDAEESDGTPSIGYPPLGGTNIKKQ